MTSDHLLFRLADVRTVNQLARALGVPLDVFREVIDCEDPRLIYFRHTLRKRNPRNASDCRIAWESLAENVARSHKAVARRLDDFARRQRIGYPNPAVHGYVLGGSTRSNAQPHCGARVVVHADIEEFFPTIGQMRIESVLCGIGMQPEPARALARFVSIDGTLPLGLPESPVISNLVCLGLDNDLQVLADQHGVKYTRYADDMTFSGAANLPSREEIRAILHQHSFRLSERKFKKSKRGQAHFVTGLSVSERDYPHVPRKMKRRLRMELHFCEKFGLASHAEAIEEDARDTYLRLEGMVKYVAFIERRKSEAINEQWTRVRKKHDGPTLHAGIADRNRVDSFIIGDETELDVGGQHYLAICFVRTPDLTKLEHALDMLLGDYFTKPGAKGDLAVLQKVGIHFTDAHFDLRTITLDLMADVLPWSASIHFARLNSPDDYKKTYLRLFGDLLKQEFLTIDGSNMEMLIEQNDKIKAPLLAQAIEAEYRHVESQGARRPKSIPKVRVVRKVDVKALTLPDFVLAAFRSYAQLVEDERVLDFERIRDRVRYIGDSDTGNYYSRKKPFMGIATSDV